MDLYSYNYLAKNPDLAKFVRYNPIWYRYLSRDPERVYEIKHEAKKFYGKTFPQRLEKVNNNVEMLGMLMKLSSEMKD